MRLDLGDRPWRARYVRLAGYVAFLKVIILCTAERLASPPGGWCVADRRAFARTITIAIGISLAMMIVLGGLTIVDVARRVGLVTALYLLPQWLPVVLPVGLTIGLVVGLGREMVSRRLLATMIALAFGTALVSLTTMGWVIPEANQTLRRSVWRAAGLAGLPSKGRNELTLGELHQEIRSERHAGRESRHLRWNYHRKVALSIAPFALGLFGLALATRRLAGRTVGTTAAFGAFLAYYLLMMATTGLEWDGPLPAEAQYLPNVAIALVAAGLVTFVPARSTPPQTSS